MQIKQTIILLTVTILFTVSCGEDKKPVEAVKPDIYGHWLLESLLNYADSTKSILGHKQFFCSEIIIDKNSDSVTIVNGDYEYWKTKYDSISENEISLENLTSMPHSNLYLTDSCKLLYFDSAAQKTFYFIKTLNKPMGRVNIDFPVMKFELNKKLFTNDFIDLETKKKVTFLPSNKVKGLTEYTDYELFINNEMSDKSESNLMRLNNPKKKKEFLTIWKFNGDTLKLYTTINTECKECKPFFERGVIWKTLLKK